MRTLAALVLIIAVLAAEALIAYRLLDSREGFQTQALVTATSPEASDEPSDLELASPDLLAAFLMSESVMDETFEHPMIRRFSMSLDANGSLLTKDALRRKIAEGMEVTEKPSADENIAAIELKFTDSDAELSKAVVTAICESTQQRVIEMQPQSAERQLNDLMTVVAEKLEPKLRELEQDYADFRRDSADAPSDEATRNKDERFRKEIARYQNLIQKALEKTGDFAELPTGPTIAFDINAEPTRVRMTPVSTPRMLLIAFALPIAAFIAIRKMFGPTIQTEAH